MTYIATAAAGASAFDEIVASSPAVFGCANPNSWRPIQRWDQPSRSFVDITSEEVERNSR